MLTFMSDFSIGVTLVPSYENVHVAKLGYKSETPFLLHYCRFFYISIGL